MKRILALAIGLALSGCHLHEEVCHYDSNGTYHCHQEDHSETTYYPESVGGYNNYIIVEEQVEEVYYCDGSVPFYHDAEYCTYGSETCCTWMGSDYGWEETWCYDDCEWYLYSYQQDSSYY